jgi:uncharacterized Tic20 family protein
MTVNPDTPPPSPHTSDERTLAALAHASALLNFVLGGVGGIVAAAVIWLTQKEKSQWVAFHGLQSLVFQSAQIVAFVIVVIVPWLCGFIVSFATFGIGAIIAVPVMILLMFIGIAIFGAGLIYSLYGAYQIYEGREFRYKWIGDWVERQSQKST